jgi:hypothetical protein
MAAWGHNFVRLPSVRVDRVVMQASENLHNTCRVASHGVFAGRDGALNRIRLRNVSPDSLSRLAAVPWVARIEPMP